MPEPEDAFLELARALRRRKVRYVLIGVAGANYYARDAGSLFATQDFDLFLPPDPANMLRAWSGCEAVGFELWAGDEPLDRPRDLVLARRVCATRALVRVTGRGLNADLTLVMGGFGFPLVHRRRQEFTVEGVRVPVASLLQIVQSKADAGRPKDRLFLATHAEELKGLMADRRTAAASRGGATKRQR